MDEHGIAFDRMKTRADRIRSLGATFDKITDVETFERGGSLVLLARADDHAHGSDGRMADQRLDSPAQHRLAAEQPKLLGDVAAHARSRFPAATMSAVVVTGGASRAACLVRQGLIHYLPPAHAALKPIQIGPVRIESR